MRSSGSTLSPPEPRVRLALVVVGDDHPRACTGRRLVRLGLARQIPRLPTGRSSALILDPYAPVPLSPADARRAASGGLVALDCSWNRLSSAHERQTGGSRSGRSGGARRLPMLLAGNPQHFGRLGELNTAEALAAALWLLGARTAAARLLEGFAGGAAFLQMNAERLARYARAGTPDRLVEEERALFGPAEAD